MIRNVVKMSVSAMRTEMCKVNNSIAKMKNQSS